MAVELVGAEVTPDEGRAWDGEKDDKPKASSLHWLRRKKKNGLGGWHGL